MKKTAAVILVVFLAVLLKTSICLAGGMTTHQMMSELAIGNVSNHDLRALLERNRDTVLYASSFPDSGYAANFTLIYSRRDQFGEVSHWPPFIEAYLSYIGDNCSPPFHDCERLVAHFMGAAAHGLEDQIYDELFLRKVYWEDLATTDMTAPNLDIPLDIMLLRKFKRWKMIPGPYVPVKELSQIYGNMDLSVSRGMILTGCRAIDMAVLSERVIEPFVQLKYKDLVPWALENIYSHPGGIEHNGKIVAQYWEVLWERLNRGDAWDKIVIGAYPEENAEDHCIEHTDLDCRVMTFFSRGIDAATVTTQSFLVTHQGNKVSGELSTSSEFGNLIIFTPTLNLCPNASYTVVITTEVKDLHGTPLPADYIYVFKTK